MPKQDTIYTCSKCGAQFPKWQGRCAECGAWGSVGDEQATTSAGHSKKINAFQCNADIIDLANIQGKDAERVKVGIEEVDRVLGGGIVPGSLILLGGEPGIGKSTLVLQVAERMAGGRKKITNSKLQITNKYQNQNLKFQKMDAESHENNVDAKQGEVLGEKQNCQSEPSSASGGVLYASGEESAEQIKMRMDRLGTNPQDIHFLSETNVESISGAIQKYKPSLAIIDSIQMLYSNEIDSECGSVAQIRACTAKLMGVAKTPLYPPLVRGEIYTHLTVEREKGSSTDLRLNTPLPAQAGLTPLKGGTNKTAIVIIGHITKDGSVAGPKTLEHLVDTVLYLEGERYHTYRILRTVKNRFGSTNEIGVFEMTGKGLAEIKNPSALFMEEHKEKLPGTIVASVMEGTRPFLIEIQALTATTNFGYPQRKVSGFDLNRLQLLLAVLQKRLGLNFNNKDVYLNIVGGFKIQEPSADLAVCLALISALKNNPLETGTVAFGEVGLGGEIRSVAQTDKRINEAKKLGFKNIICPNGKKSLDGCAEFSTLAEAVGKVFGKNEI